MSLLLRMAQIDPASEKGRALSRAIAEGGELPAEIWGFLVDTASRFLLGGGAWSAREWAELARVEQAACAEAGMRLRVVGALQGGKAYRGGIEEAAVAAWVDGGESLEQEATALALERGYERAISAMRGGCDR